MPPYAPPFSVRSEGGEPPIDGLRRRVRALEGARGLAAGQGVALGLPLLDRHLPWGGLPRGALHEVLGDGGPATLFAVALAARLAGREGAILWCARQGALDAGLPCPAGLAAMGLDPARLVLVTARRDEDALWAMEEGLRARSLAAVVGEAMEASLTATRRLALAAEAGEGAAFLLRPDAEDPTPSAAATRWRIVVAPSAPDTGLPRFRADLFRCRGGAPGAWLMGWCDEAGGLAVSAALHDRAADPAPARLAG